MIVLERETITRGRGVRQGTIIKRRGGDLDHSLILAIIIISKEAEVAQERKDSMWIVMKRNQEKR